MVERLSAIGDFFQATVGGSLWGMFWWHFMVTVLHLYSTARWDRLDCDDSGRVCDNWVRGQLQQQLINANGQIVKKFGLIHCNKLLDIFSEYI